jgi:hypothetical protein
MKSKSKGWTWPPLVLVEWVDSHRSEGWHAWEPRTEPLVCRSVGYLVRRNRRAVTVAASVTREETAQRCGEITIPTCAIRKVRRLKAGDR